MQRIGLVLSEVPGYSEIFFTNKIKGLKAAGFEVILFVQKRDPNFDLCAVIEAPKVYKYNKLLQAANTVVVVLKMSFSPKRLIKFIKLERSSKRTWSQLFKNIYNNSHILRAHLDWLHFGFATLAIESECVAKAINANMAVSIRGFDIGIYPIEHPNCYTLLWEYLDKLHAISNDLLALAYKEGMRKSMPYQIITPAIDTKLFSVNIGTEDQNSIRFISVARLHWKKGLIYTLEALSILKAKGIEFEYVVIGTGKERERLMFAAEQLGLLEHVIFKGRLTHKDVQFELAKSTIFLQYSIQEGFCNAVLEAQSMGLLCVVSDAEGLQENILHNETGWVVPKRKPLLLAKKIVEVIDLPDADKKRISNRAIMRVQKEFNIQKQQLEFVDFYSS